MANAFDQFDTPSSASGKTNAFDQFHEPTTSTSGAATEDDPNAGVAAGMKRGFLERGTGVDQLLNQIGVGGMMPVFVNGKLSFGLPPNEELAKRERTLEAQGKDTGAKGFIGELAGDPINLLPTGKLGLTAAGGLQGMLSSLTSPSTKEDQTLSERGKGMVLGTAEGAGTGKLLGAAGSKLTSGARPAGGAMSVPSSIYQAAQKLGLKFTGKETPEEIWGKIQTVVKDKVNEIAERASPGSPASKVWPVGVNLATSQMYGVARVFGNKLYTNAKALGAKESVPAEGITKDIDSLIADMEKEAPYQVGNPRFGSTMTAFKNLRENIAASDKPVDESPWEKIQRLMGGPEAEKTPEKIRGDQLIEIDQALNEHYGRAGGEGKTGRAYANLQNKVQDAIKQMSPEFSSSYQKAKNYWRQNVIQNFEENKVLAKHWNVDDYQAFKAMAKGIDLHPNLKARVEGLLDKIDSPLALDELKKSLPPEMYDSVRAAKFMQIMNKAGLDSKAIGDDQTYALLAKSLANKHEDLQALDAIKTFVEHMNDRGLKRDLTPAELEKSDKYTDRAMRTVFSFATGHKLYGLQHLLQTVTGDTPSAVQGKLTGFAKNIAKGEPKPAYTPGIIPKLVNKGAATEEGKGSQP